MKIIIAPDSFKGTLTAREACAAMADGVRAVDADAELVEAPLADGGEGTVDTILAATGGSRRVVDVRGPLGGPVRAVYGLLNDGGRAVLEMSAASGILLIPPDERDVLRATTFGTGELIGDALAAGARKLLIGIGGSATCDGGCGMAQALGVRFHRADGGVLPSGMGGGVLCEVDRIDPANVDPRFRECSIDVLCDVRNPLYGPTGAAAVYAPQKGASDDDVARLDAGLRHLARIIERDLGVAIADLPGGGAAGGLGAGFVAFVGGCLRAGAPTVIDFLGLDMRCVDATCVITGEGRFDRQSLAGKVVSAVAELGARHDVPVLVVAGQVALSSDAWCDVVADVAACGDPGDDPAGALKSATIRLLLRHLSHRGFGVS